MAIPQPNHQGIYVRNFLTIFVCLSLVAYVNYQITNATSEVELTNAIVNSMLRNETYSMKQERLYQLQNSLKAKQYSQLSQAQCLVRIYLDVLNNQKFASYTQQKPDSSSSSTIQLVDRIQLNFNELTFPTMNNDLEGFRSCSDILTMMNFLNPTKTDFIYSNFMQQKYGVFVGKEEESEGDKDGGDNNNGGVSFCIMSYQTNTSSHKLRQSIHSLITQTYQNYKLIILDNASTDGSYQIAKVILQDLKQKLIEQNKQKQKQIRNKYQIIHEQNKLGLWELLRKHDKMCQGQDYVVIVDGRDQLSTEWVLDVMNKRIEGERDRPAFITTASLRKKELSRMSPAQINVQANKSTIIPTFTFKVLSLEMYNSLKQKIFQQTSTATHPYKIQQTFIKNCIDYCRLNNKPILNIDQMLYVYDTIENKQIDRNEYFIKTVKENSQKLVQSEHKAQ